MDEDQKRRRELFRNILISFVATIFGIIVLVLLLSYLLKQCKNCKRRCKANKIDEPRDEQVPLATTSTSTEPKDLIGLSKGRGGRPVDEPAAQFRLPQRVVNDEPEQSTVVVEVQAGADQRQNQDSNETVTLLVHQATVDYDQPPPSYAELFGTASPAVDYNPSAPPIDLLTPPATFIHDVVD